MDRFLLTSYNWYWNDQLDGTLHLDARQKKNADSAWARTSITSFPEHSARALSNIITLTMTSPGWTSTAADRRRTAAHLVYASSHSPKQSSRRRLQSVTRAMLKSFVIFFETEYRKNVQPSTFAEVTNVWQNFSLNALGQAQVNEFFETVERLPDC